MRDEVDEVVGGSGSTVLAGDTYVVELGRWNQYLLPSMVQNAMRGRPANKRQSTINNRQSTDAVAVVCKIVQARRVCSTLILMN